MGQKETSHIMINYEVGSEVYVIEELKIILCVKETHGIMGTHDIVVEIKSPFHDELQKTITMKIRKIGINKMSYLKSRYSNQQAETILVQ